VNSAFARGVRMRAEYTFVTVCAPDVQRWVGSH
jgi:hypothetical protein